VEGLFHFEFFCSQDVLEFMSHVFMTYLLLVSIKTGVESHVSITDCMMHESLCHFLSIMTMLYQAL